MQMFPVYMLLAGYSIENLFKGIIICKTWLDDPDVLNVDDFEDIRVPTKGNGLPMSLKTHNLRELLEARAMTLSFEDNKKAVMGHLTEYIEWGGKYPVSLEFYRHYIRTNGVVDTGYRPFEVIELIYEKSRSELNRLYELQRLDQRFSEWQAKL
jgi:hypothetical protein